MLVGVAAAVAAAGRGCRCCWSRESLLVVVGVKTSHLGCSGNTWWVRWVAVDPVASCLLLPAATSPPGALRGLIAGIYGLINLSVR